MAATSRPVWLRYGFGLIAVALATVGRLALGPIIGERIPFATYYLALLATLWFSGVGPGAVALLVGGLAGSLCDFGTGGQNEHPAGLWVGLALYVVVGLGFLRLLTLLERRRLELEDALVERRRAESDLAESEKRFRQLAETMKDVFWIMELTGRRVLYVNPAYEAIWGRPRRELQEAPSSWLDSIHPEDRTRVERAFAEKVVEGTFDEQYRIVRSDGSIRWVRDRAFPIADAQGVVYRAGGLAEDITERKQAEAALIESERRFRQLAEAMPQIVWESTAEGTINYLNARWYEMTGLNNHAVPLSIDDRQVVHPDDLGQVLMSWEKAREEGTPFEAEYRLRHHGRRDYRWYLGRAVPVRDDSGEVARWYGTATEIQARKQAEEALAESDRRKDEFINVLAHELRNPLAPVRTSLHLLREGRYEQGEDVHLWEIVDRQVERLVGLVEDLLDISRINTGQVALRPERTDVAALAREAARACERDFQGHGVTIDLALPDGPVPIEADAVRLEQVLIHLLKNAARYSKANGHVVVSVEADEQRVRVRVRDDGIGVPRDRLDDIFQPFVQVDRRSDAAFGGLGLGLTLARSLVHLHDGSLTAESDGLGHGSEFVVQLPRTGPGGRSAREGTHFRHEPSPMRHRVLVVDDNHEAADSLAHMLRKLWHQEVHVAYDGTTALRHAEAFQPDIVFLDLGMPGLDGYEVAKRLRGRPEFRHTLIVANTGWGQDEDRKRSREAGCDVHLVKPVEPEVYRALLGDHASNRRR